MALMRSMLLAAAQNAWLRDRASHYRFVRRTVSRFMPGETLAEALQAAANLRAKKIASVFTHLGENIADSAEAAHVTDHYLNALTQIHNSGLAGEISVKLTQLGLDLSKELCYENVLRLIDRERRDAIVWIDMEGSNYVDRTLEIYRRVLRVHPNVGICLQAYLRRTREDLATLLPLRPAIRLVKGAYAEPAEIAFAEKRDVDENFFQLGAEMLAAHKQGRCARAAFGTHDVALIRRLAEFAAGQQLPKEQFEIQMLFGIQRAEQERLAQQDYRSVVLVAYGTHWYAWFVRRLAERPANVWFMLRNLFAA
jgi:proline dehydrogenase